MYSLFRGLLGLDIGHPHPAPARRAPSRGLRWNTLIRDRGDAPRVSSLSR